VSLGRKLCLFVCYVEQVGKKQWVAKGVVSIQWRREIRHCMMNIRRGEFKGKEGHVCCIWLHLL
jgi:hypothetical protein